MPDSAVLRVKFGHNPFEPLRAGNLNQPGNQFAAQSLVLIPVGDNDSELGFL
jgi:hypothetical protein